MEATGFRDELAAFGRLGVQIIGASADSAPANTRFRRKHDLPFKLLCDNEAKDLGTAFGVWQAKKMAGRSYMGIVRSSFLIDADGVVELVFPKVKTGTHARDVLDALDK